MGGTGGLSASGSLLECEVIKTLADKPPVAPEEETRRGGESRLYDSNFSRSSTVKSFIRLTSDLQNRVGQRAFLPLQLGDFFFDRVAADEAVGEDVARLAHAVGAVDGLGFDGRVPPGVEQEDVVGGRQVEAQAARFEADQEDAALRVGLEAVDPLLAVARLAVEVFVDDAAAVEVLFHDRQHARELREDERLVPFGDQLLEVRQQDVELGRRFFVGALADEGRMAGGLPQAQQRFEHVHFALGEALRGRFRPTGRRGSCRADRGKCGAAPSACRSGSSARVFRAARRRPLSSCGGG